VIAEMTKPITAAVATNGMNFGALRMSTSAVLVFSIGLATRTLNQREMVFYFGAGSRGVNRTGSHGGIPA
jgi:hypothetical protein